MIVEPSMPTEQDWKELAIATQWGLAKQKLSYRIINWFKRLWRMI